MVRRSVLEGCVQHTMTTRQAKNPAMRIALASLAWWLAWAGCAMADDRAQRIVSINLCTDQLLLLLAERQRIASVSFMASNAIYSAYAERVGDLPLNHARIEEIVAYQPDLVLAYELSDSMLVNFLRRLGYRVELVAVPETLTQVSDTILSVAELLGERDRGVAVVEQMSQHLAQAEARHAGKQRPLAVIYGPNGYSPGANTLSGSVLETAGFRNLSRQMDNNYGATIPLEQLLFHRPEVFVISDEEPNVNSMAQKKLSHPALRRTMTNARVAHVTARYWSCPTPEIVNAVDELERAL